MKRKTKKRIELLRLAIKAAEKRCDELYDCIDTASCPLCMNLMMGCMQCPAKRSDFTCAEYSSIIETIQNKLMVQAECWRKEIEDLMKT